MELACLCPEDNMAGTRLLDIWENIGAALTIAVLLPISNANIP
jgi:hypothetical protein